MHACIAHLYLLHYNAQYYYSLRLLVHDVYTTVNYNHEIYTRGARIKKADKHSKNIIIIPLGASGTAHVHKQGSPEREGQV